jgi:hypothetical protein
MSKTLQKVTTSIAIIGMLGTASIALAASNTLTCFSGTTDGGTYGGTCTLGPGGTATLANNSSNPNGDYSGVYYSNSTLQGQTVSSVTQLGYHYTGTKTPTPTELSLNFTISTGDTVFVDAAYCPGVGGTVDVINDPACGIYVNGSTFYPNWAAFVASLPGGTTITDTPFIVAERVPSDVSQTWTVSNLQLGGPATATNKDQCKNNGWQNVVRANGTTFKNQGDCIQYANTGK